MAEMWKPIKEFDGRYQVSNLGNVVSLNYHNEKRAQQLKLIISKKGYVVVKLYKNGKMYNREVHRLVAEAFLPNPDNLPQVNHKDENKANNFVGNLEWCDAYYNTNYGTRTAKTSCPVIATVVETGEQEYYPSIIEASRQLGKRNANIWRALRGKRNNAYGRIWKEA